MVIDLINAPTEFAIGVQRRIFNWALKRARLSKGYTMKRLAEAVGCHVQYLYRIASFRDYPSERLRDRICITLEVPENILFPSWLSKAKLLKQPEPIAITPKQLRTADLLALQAPSMEEDEARNILHDEIVKVVDTLDAREKKVITLRFGLEDGNPRTHEEVGKVFGVTRERIRQIEAKALTKLRHPTRSRKLKDLL